MTEAVVVAEERLLRRREVEHKTGLTRSTLYDLMAKDEFPKPISVTRKTVAWLESEVQAWISNRVKSARAADSRSR